jgi:hypothetical protein
MEAPGYMNDRTGFGSDSAYAKSLQQNSGVGVGGSRYDAGTSRGAQSLEQFFESSEEETSSDEETDSDGSSDESSEEDGSSDGAKGEESSDGSGSEDSDESDEDESEESSSSEEEEVLPAPRRTNGRR